MTKLEIISTKHLAPFTFRWPAAVEEFEQGWECDVTIDGAPHVVKHGIGQRVVYGRPRVHTVTWLDATVQVEGVEADDYPTSQALISRLRRTDGKLAGWFDEVQRGYEGFLVVRHRSEIDAPHSPNCLAVKVREDDLKSWAGHAWLRSCLKKVPSSLVGAVHRQPVPPRPRAPTPSLDEHAVVRALLAHGGALATQLAPSGAQFTADPSANQLLVKDPFAFLLAVISDMGIKAERAWALPFELRRRLGYLDPARVAANSEAVYRAVQSPPTLHRFINLIPKWIVEAARIVEREYGGDAGSIWRDGPTATELRRRLERFPGIAQKKAAMAVEILERDIGVPVVGLDGGHVAVDVHVRRVFLRTGLTQHDDVQEIVEVARQLHRERPGALDLPTWDIGRRWCHPKDPDCQLCPLTAVCPRLIERGSAVSGI